MINVHTRASAVGVVVVWLSASFFAQTPKRIIECKSEVFAVAKKLPSITYQCPADASSDSDDLILKTPERRIALERVARELELIVDPQWWNAPLTDLNACYLHDKTGELNADETEQFLGPEYQATLLGDSRLRLVVLPDPCYQTSYNGANAFVMYRKGQKVYATQALDGYFSRLGKSIFLHVRYTPAGPTVRLETLNISGMRPQTINYYFSIDRVTNRAVPKNHK